MKVFRSWTMKSEISKAEISYDVFDEVGRSNLNKIEEALPIKKIESLLHEENEQALAGSIAGKSMKFYTRKKKKILRDLENIAEISSLQKLAENEAFLVGLPSKYIHNGVKLKFDSKDYYKRRNDVYIKIKKFKKAKEILALRLADTEKVIAGHGEVKKINTLKTIPVVWKNQVTRLTEIKVPDKQYKIIDIGAICLGVGISALGNDQLRSEWANKSDFWFHLDGDKSAHIIVKLRERVLDQIVFEVVASALVEFTKVDYRQANMVYTQVKNLKGVKGAAGKVIYKKEKRIQVDCHSDWRDTLHHS